MAKFKKTISIALLFAWVAIIVWAFWWFQIRLNSSIEKYMKDELFTTSNLPSKPHSSDAEVTVYHFLDSDCPCTKFNTAHVKSVINKYQKLDVDFVIVVPDKVDLTEAKRLFPTSHHIVADRKFYPPASPAAFIMTAPLSPHYIGPWSPSAICSNHDEDYVSGIIDGLLKGKQLNQTHHLARGCLCPWPSSYKV